MKKYMLIPIFENNGEMYTVPRFFDDLDSVETARMDYTCGVGADCSVYEFNEKLGHYEFLYA